MILDLIMSSLKHRKNSPVRSRFPCSKTQHSPAPLSDLCPSFEGLHSCLLKVAGDNVKNRMGIFKATSPEEALRRQSLLSSLNEVGIFRKLETISLLRFQSTMANDISSGGELFFRHFTARRLLLWI